MILLVGPTAVGKTEIAIRLAERIDGEIISADSRLFYRGMDIGTAKPSHAEQSRIPHHLIDIADPDEILSLSVFQHGAAGYFGDSDARQIASAGGRHRAIYPGSDTGLDAA